MRPEFNPASPRDGRDGNKDSTRNRRDKEVRPVVEREVPLGHQSERVLSPSVHAWLDGELPEAALRKGDTARDVQFWHEVTDQMERRRHLRTPEHVEAQIMSALPHHAPQLITPWWRREFVITPMAAVAAATALVTLAIAATAAIIGP